MHALYPLVLIGLIAFAFGERVARVVTAAGLVAAALFFLYVLLRIAAGSI